MLGLHPISSAPLSSLSDMRYRVVVVDRIPIEILSTVQTIVEQIDIPIEIEIPKTDALTLKWVLKSRGQQWVVDAEILQWILQSSDKKWTVNSNPTKWSLNSRPTKWTIK